MCSIQEDGDLVPEKKPATNHSKKCHKSRRGSLCLVCKKCMKCGEQASVIIRVNDPFCRSCFLSYCVHKFRSAFGKSKKLIQDGEKVLVAFSGGSGAKAMVHLIQEGLSERAKKKLRFIPALCFIDEGAAMGHSNDQRLAYCEEVCGVMQAAGFPTHMVALEQVLLGGQNTDHRSQGLIYYPDSISEKDFDDEAGSKLTALLSSVKSNTGREDLLHTLRQKLLVDVAAEHSYRKVILGDCSTRLSAKLLSNIAQGRGSHLPLDVGFTDGRFGDIVVVRPMREFTAKEIAMYNVFHSLESVVIPSLSTKVSTNASINRLTESFVNGLQASFPSTITTIMRTGEKLDLNQSEMLATSTGDHDDFCVMCRVPLDTVVPQSSALNSTLHSESMSQKPVSVEDRTSCQLTGCACDGETSGCCSSQTDRQTNGLSRHEVIGTLCYGCRLITKDIDDIRKLPAQVLQDAEWRIKRTKMRASVEEFLLTDDDNHCVDDMK